MKSFGPKNRAVKPAPRESFEFTMLRDGDPETHTFNAVCQTDAAALAFMLGSVEKHPERSMIGLFRMIAKMLDNKDGTPAKWEPTPLPPPALEIPDDEGDLEPIEHETKFRGPDGALYTMDHAARFTDLDAGSSRRRWLQLMEDDDEVIVDAEDLVKLFEWLISVAARRPTVPSS